MTLVLNEIHLLDGLRKTLLVAAADRSISKPNGAYDSTRRKLFPIPYLNGAVSYFGLATVFPRNRPQCVSDWLPGFIRQQSSVASIQCFAVNMTEILNRIVPPSILHKYPSGFHVCGYEHRGYPDFWFVSNIGGMTGFQYTDLRSAYLPAESHFLGRDASNVHGWDGSSPQSARNGVQVYRNGDYRAHVAASELLDEIYKKLEQFPDFKVLRTPHDYGEYVKFKFEFIAYLYKKWARQKIIARPIDVLVLQGLQGRTA